MRQPRIDRYVAGRRIAYIASLLIGLVALALGASLGGEQPLSPGALSSAHQLLQDDCARCHTVPFRDVRAILGTDAQRAMNAACLDCHGKRIGHERISLDPHHGSKRRRAESTACADCHVEHESTVQLSAVADPACVRCHADLEPPITRFAASGGPGDHPEFLRPQGSDPGTLTFDHRLHLKGGRSTCSDCHRSQDPTGEHKRGAYMAQVTYEAACKSCHALSPTMGGASFAVPHERPALVRDQLLQRARERDIDEAAVAEGVAALMADGGSCSRCHRIDADASPPRIVPVAIPARWYPRSHFDHGSHTAIGFRSQQLGTDAECRHCHVSALTSTQASDVSIPGIDTCRQCHGQGASDRCSGCHVFHQLGPKGLHDYETAPPEIVASGREETRFGMRRSTAYWPLKRFFELPETKWNRPDIEPRSDAFYDEVWRRYGLFRADFDNDGLPLGLIKTTRKRDSGEDGMAVTCEFCHSSSLFGKIVHGQPNRFSNMERLFLELSDKPNITQTDQLFLKNPPRNTVVNAADHLGLEGLLIRDPGMAISLPTAGRMTADAAMSLKPLFDAIAYIKTPPWYTYRTKLQGAAGYYFDGGHSKDGNFSAFTYLIAFHQLDGADVREALTAWMEGGHAFLASLEAPAYPFSIDRERAAQGRLLYRQHCARCHGSYQGDEATAANLSYPGLVIDIDEVGTDPARTAFPKMYVEQIRRILRDDYRAARGYVAMPLTAIWARAPYLHNGSVPTLDKLLNPKQRPERWALTAHPDNARDYLQDEIGWRYEVLAPGAESEHERVHDPAVMRGLTNGGHTFGAELSAAEKKALLAFMKTL